MEKFKAILKKLFRPPIAIVLTVTAVACAGLVLVFSVGLKYEILTYIVYFISAYALVVLLPRVVDFIKVISSKVKNGLPKLTKNAPILQKYFSDRSFRGEVGLYTGLTMNILYTAFRLVSGIVYGSVWFISLGVYYAVLALSRFYLIYARKRHAGRLVEEYKSYVKTAVMLFVLNLPMGGMIVLMVLDNAGFSYPGYVIYLSAAYTFYTAIIAIVNIGKYRKLGSPILSAAKGISLITAMMSVLGLQTAMISAFAESGESYAIVMNAITGGIVFFACMGIEIYMLTKGTRAIRAVRQEEQNEQIGK